jgi:type II secretory pathway pseudopilin PulG
MTFWELLLAVVVLALTLAAITGLYARLVDQAKIRDTTRMIAALARAVELYHEAAGDYPECPAGPADAVIERLLTLPQCARIIESAAPQGSQRLGVASAPARFSRDAWGTPLRYVSPSAVLPFFSERIRLAGGVPIFESAGPDLRFGDTDTMRQPDNIRSDEPLAVVIDDTRQES